MEEIKQIILSLEISAQEKEQLLKQLKAVQKRIANAEFQYQRTMMDKAAITNILNASIVEIEKQKAVIDRQKREALNRASLDRVRAEIASMRSTKDLERITPLIWDELTIMNIPFIRSGVILIDEEDDKKVGIYLSTPDGKGIASFQIPAYKTEFSQKIFDYWKNKQTLIEHWDAKTFFDWAKSLAELKAIESEKKYITDHPPQNLYLHFLPFEHGMLYVGNGEPLTEDQLNLVQSLVIAFSTAYARYDDFKRLEATKQQVEKTLHELRSAQQQLIQSEKMASLGELTAGIAHEIQNPLNFVNNFSEVNTEMIEEASEEISKGNYDEAKNILNDIKENSEKINHHGKRAADIVKGMLQHSRTSTGQKELTDINALCDEYFRLSYHGLRAKDKTFNAKFETDFDTNLPKINVLPQDIGRVILNLINNAFYAVSEKAKSSKQNAEGYEPTVSVSTKSLGDKVEVKVKDNGNGIPSTIKDKIFQPFFTTKPTGSGTGLGLSLSYDIITKGHAGELKVETKEGRGSEFIILLPG